MPGKFMIYGATGYTGKLTAKAAAEKGLKPVLAGRSVDKLRALAEPLGLDWVAFTLDRPNALDKALADVDAVLHIAGPFSATSEPMLDACLRTKTHYLDITGEIDVFEACAARDAEARKAGIMVLPGAGFDVVPSDCLAAHVARRLPAARRLEIGISGMNNPSHGTAKTMVESISSGTRARRDAQIVTLSKAPRRTFDYGTGDKTSIAVGWGDVSTAYHSTGIGDITIYFEASKDMERMAGLGAAGRWVLGTGPMQYVLKSLVDRLPEGPTDAQRAAGHTILVAEASDDAGHVVRTRLETPEGYTLTMYTGLELATRAAAGDVTPGFQTPSSAYGADFILGFDGVTRADLNA